MMNELQMYEHRKPRVNFHITIHILYNDEKASKCPPI